MSHFIYFVEFFINKIMKTGEKCYPLTSKILRPICASQKSPFHTVLESRGEPQTGRQTKHECKVEQSLV